MNIFLKNKLSDSAFLKFQQGFTLLEVLVAMAISSLVYMGAYSLLDSVLKTNEKVSEKRVALENLQRCFHIMQQDISQIIPRSVRTEFGESSPAVEYQGVSGQFEFTRLGWRNPIHRPRSTMQRVSYFIEDNVLYRQHWQVLDRNQDSEPKKNELLGDVEKLELRFYDPVQGEWITSWGEELTNTTPTTGDVEKILPSAIEIKLKTKAYGEIVRIFPLVDNPLAASVGASEDD